MKEVGEGNCNVVLFLKRLDVAFLLWLPWAELIVGKAFCTLSFSVSSPCPSLVWKFVLFMEFSRRWFRMELLAMAVSVLETPCYSPCVWVLRRQELCGAATVSLEWMPVSDMKLWAFNCCPFLFRSRPDSAPGLWGRTLAELQREQPCQPLPTSLFGSFPCSRLSLFLSAKVWVKQGKEPFLSGKWWLMMINSDPYTARTACSCLISNPYMSNWNAAQGSYIYFFFLLHFTEALSLPIFRPCAWIWRRPMYNAARKSEVASFALLGQTDGGVLQILTCT